MAFLVLSGLNLCRVGRVCIRASAFAHQRLFPSSQRPSQSILMNSAHLTNVLVTDSDDALELIRNVLDSSTEYSIIGTTLDGTINLWNEGARRLYSYDPEEVIGQVKSDVLYTPEDLQAAPPREVMEKALREGRWEG